MLRVRKTWVSDKHKIRFFRNWGMGLEVVASLWMIWIDCETCTAAHAPAHVHQLMLATCLVTAKFKISEKYAQAKTKWTVFLESWCLLRVSLFSGSTLLSYYFFRYFAESDPCFSKKIFKLIFKTSRLSLETLQVHSSQHTQKNL